MRLSGDRIGHNSIKDSFDHLPTGMGYFHKNGLPILVNHRMDQLFFEMVGRDLQYEKELADAIAGLKNQIFFDQEERVWKFSINYLQGCGNEYIAADITAIYRENQMLMEKNCQLKEVNAVIAEIGKNYAAIAREEEILSMKMRIHSELGRCGLDIQNYYQNGCRPEERQGLIGKLQQAVALLKGNPETEDEEDPVAELLRTAETVGAEIRISGQMPEETEVRQLLIPAMRECLINAIRHAEGSILYVDIEETNQEYHAAITNNGRRPDTEITEGGGLSSLRQRTERAGGVMYVRSFPRFCMLLQIPKGYRGGADR